MLSLSPFLKLPPPSIDTASSMPMMSSSLSTSPAPVMTIAEDVARVARIRPKLETSPAPTM